MFIANEVCHVLENLTQNALRMNGSAIFEEIFDITFSVMDALTVTKISWSNSADLEYLLDWFSLPPYANSKYRTILDTRVKLGV